MYVRDEPLVQWAIDDPAGFEALLSRMKEIARRNTSYDTPDRRDLVRGIRLLRVLREHVAEQTAVS